MSDSYPFATTAAVTFLFGSGSYGLYRIMAKRATHRYRSNQLCEESSIWASRALPNQRLVRAFGIDNAFTTTDKEYSTTFRSLAKGKIHSLSDDKWKGIADFADGLIKHRIQEESGPTGDKVQLDELVRSLCLRITLYVLFDRNPVDLDDQAISDITTSINDLWHESKTGSPSKSNKTKLKTAMADIFAATETGATSYHWGRVLNLLARAFPQSDPQDHQQNPLDLILPAYETLWRVVLFCFIEVTFRPGALPEWKEVLGRFLNEPTQSNLKNRDIVPNGGNLCVQFIFDEALRLYPSTKSVYRQYHMSSKKKPQIVVASTEACHRTPKLWQPEPDRFRPSRWSNVSKEALESFMPFGGILFRCPAQTECGPKIIGVLVAALTANISSEDWTLKLFQQKDKIGKELAASDFLTADRKTYERIELVRKSG